MADPKKPKQLSEATPLVEFTQTGNIYVDPAYTSEEATPAVSPVTGEALTFGENTLSSFTVNNNNSPSINPEDGHAIFVTNVKRNTARGNGNDIFFNYNRSKMVGDIYITNTTGGDFSATPRVADTYVADSDGILSVYIEGSTFGGNLMGFGSQTNTSQTFTGDYEFTFKNSQAQWFCITYGTGYGMGEGGAGNIRFGTLYGNMDLLVEGSTITNNGVILAGGMHPGDGSEKAYLRAAIINSLFQGEFGVIKTGTDGTMFKSEVDVDVTIDGSTFANVFLMFPNVATNTQARNGDITTTGDVNFKATNTKFAGLNMGAGLGGTGWNRTGWIKGNINFNISDSTNSSRTFIHKGFIGTADEPNTVTGTLTNSVFGDFTGYDTRENNYIYADTTVKMTGSTIGNFTFYNTINSGNNVTPTADRVFGVQTLELTGVVAGSVAGNGPGADQNDATFDLAIHASETQTQVGAISNWDSITIDAGANVRASSISFLTEEGKLTIGIGSSVTAASISGINAIYVTGELTEADTVIVSGLNEDGISNDLVLYVGDAEVEYTKGIFPGFWEVVGGNLTIHNASSTVLLVNSNYVNGQPTDLGPKGYTSIANAQAAVTDPVTTTIMVYGEDTSVEQSTFSEAVKTLTYTTSLVGSESNKINLDGQDLIAGHDVDAVDSTNVTASYTNNINNLKVGNVTGTAKVSIDHALAGEEDAPGIANVDLTGVNVGDAQISISDSVIGSVKLADQEGFVGNVTIKNSTIGSVYGAASGATNDLTGENEIGTVYAEGNGPSIKLGSSKVTAYVAGLSAAAEARESLVYDDSVTAGTLVLGDATVAVDDGEATVTGIANSIGKIDATINGGNVEKLIVGAENNTVGEIDLTIAGGKLTDVAIADNATVTGPINVTLQGGTIANFTGSGEITTSADTSNTFYGLIYGASVTGALDAGTEGTERILNVEGHAKVASVANFTALNVTGGTLNVAGGDRKSSVTDENTLSINGDILNERTINAGIVTAVNLNNFGAVGTLRQLDQPDTVALNLSGDLNNFGVVATASAEIGGDLINTRKITALGDITVGGSFVNSGDLYFYATSSREGVFTQNGGLNLNNVDLINTGFISAGKLTGVKNLSTSKLYVTGGAEISGNITIDAGAEVAFTNKANQEVQNGLSLGGSITMYDNSNLVVSGDLTTSGTKTITVNVGDMIGANEIVRAEGSVDSWTIKLVGDNAGMYSYVQDSTSVTIYSLGEVFVNSAFSADGKNVVDGNTLAYGINAFATVEEAVAAAKSGAKIIVVNDATGMDVTAASFDVELRNSIVGAVTAKTLSVSEDSSVASIDAASSLTIAANALLTVTDTIAANLPIVIDATAGSGSRLVLDVDPEKVALSADQVSILGKEGYKALVLDGEGEGAPAHAGDLFLISSDNAYYAPGLFTTVEDVTTANFVDGDTFDAATGDALFNGVNTFSDRAEAVATAKDNGGIFVLVDNVVGNKVGEDGVVSLIEVDAARGDDGQSRAIVGVSDGTAYVSDQDHTTMIVGSTSRGNVYGLSREYTMSGDYTFIAKDSISTGASLFMTGNSYNSVMNGDVNAMIDGCTFGTTYIGYGSFGTTDFDPIDVNVTINNSRTGQFRGINISGSTPATINANINISVYDSMIGGAFYGIGTADWVNTASNIYQASFVSGSVNVEVGGTTVSNQFRPGDSIPHGANALQTFNVPTTLHVVATEKSAETRADWVMEWDTIIIDADATLRVNNGLEYVNAYKSATDAIDNGGQLIQIYVNMSGYAGGTRTVITTGFINTDANMSNISVIGDNDMTGQRQLVYGVNTSQGNGLYHLDRVAIFDKADDMYVNASYTESISGSTAADGQELYYNANAHSEFEGALGYATEWGGTIVLTGGTFEAQNFNGNNVDMREGKVGAVTMGDRQESTLKVGAKATFDSADGSGKSALDVDGNAVLGDVKDFTSVSVDKGAAVDFGDVSGSDINLFADNVITADSLDFSDATITIDVSKYLGKAHAVISTENGITGTNVQLVGTDAEKYGYVITDTDLVVTTTLQSDTYLNAEYTAATTGTILADGTYLQYGFNAFSTAEDAVANLGSAKNTVFVTGSSIGGDITLNGANFAMEGGVLEGFIYGTADDDFSGMNIAIDAGKVGGIALTAGDGAYSVSKAAITFGDGITVDGVVAGAGDTTITMAGSATVGGIEDVKQITLTTSSLLSAGYIDMAGGTVYVTGGAVESQEGNLHKIISTEGGITGVSSYACDPGLTIYASGKDVYLMDLTRIYFDPNFTEAVTGTTMANGDMLQWGDNAFSNLTDAMNHVVTGGTLYVANYNGDVVNSATNKVISLNISDGTVGTFRPIGGDRNNSKFYDPVTITLDNVRVTAGIDYILGRANSWDNVGNSLVYYAPVTINMSNGRNDDNLRFVGQWSTIASGITINLTNWDIRGDFKPIFGDARANGVDGDYHSFIDMTWDNVTLGNAGAKWIAIANVTDWGKFDYINFTIKNSTLMTGTGGNNARISVFDEGNDGRHNGEATPITFTVEDSHINAMLAASNLGNNRTTTYKGTSTLNIVGTESYIKWANWFQVVNMSVDTLLTGGTITFRPGTYQVSEDETVDTTGVINVDATGYTGGSKILINLETGFQNVEPGSEEFLLNLKQDSDKYTLVASTKAMVIWDGNVTNLFYNPGYVDNNAVVGQTGPNGEILVKTILDDEEQVKVLGNAYGEEEGYSDLLGFEDAKKALAAGNTLFITGGTFGSAEELTPIYGTIAEQDSTAFVNLGVTGGRFSSIVVAEDGKTVTGDANLELLGGNYGFSYTYEEDQEVTVTDPETGETSTEWQTVTLTGYTGGDLVGSKDSVGGVSTLTVSANVNVHGNVSEFDKMVVKSNATMSGDVSVTTLEIDCNNTLTVNGALDLDAIHLASAEYEGPSKVVLKAAGLADIADLGSIITVDGEDQFYYDGEDSLWLISEDPGNVYFCSDFTEAINGTSYNGDLLVYGVNAFSAMSEEILLTRTTSDYTIYVLNGVFDGVYDVTGLGQVNIQIDGGTVGGFVVGDGADSDHRSTVRVTATTAAAAVGSLAGVEGSTIGYRVIANKDAKFTSIDGIQYFRFGAGQNVSVTDHITYREAGGELVVNFADYAGGAGTILNPANGISNFLQYNETLADGTTVSRTVVGAQNNANMLMPYLDEATGSVKVAERGKFAFLDANANAAMNGTVVGEGANATTQVYGYNLSNWNVNSGRYAITGGTLFADGGTAGAFYWFFTAAPINVNVTGITTGGFVAGYNDDSAADQKFRDGDFTAVIDATTITWFAAIAGQGNADAHQEMVVGNWNAETESYDDTAWNVTITNGTHDTNDFRIARYANLSGGTVNVTIADYALRGDLMLFDRVYNGKTDGVDSELKEVNVTLSNVNAPAAKWIQVWEPQESNSTKINLTITDSTFTGDTMAIGLFGADTTGAWSGEADVYISGVTMADGNLNGGRGQTDGGLDNISGYRVLHVTGGTSRIRRVREFTTIEIAADGFLTGSTISMADDANYILRGEAGYTGDVREFAVVGTTITGTTTAEFLDADDNEIDGYKAVVGSTSVFIYRPTYDVYYSSDYNEATTGAAITEADGTKNFLVYGDNAVSAMKNAYASVDARGGSELATIQVVNGSGTLYTFGYKTVVNGGQFANVVGGTNYKTTTTQVDSGEVDPETGEPIMVDVTEVTPAETVASVDITVKAGATVTNLTVASQYSQVSGDALITVADGVAFNGTLNGGVNVETGDDYVGGNSALVFEGDATAKSILGFDSVTLNANGLVEVTSFSGSAITIDATNFEDFSKKVLVVNGGFDVENLPAVTVIGDGFGYQFLDDGKTLLVTSDLVGNVFANADWTEADVKDQFIGEMALVWDKNAFASFSAAAAAVTGTNALNISGGSSAENVALAGKNDVVVSGDTAATAVGALSSAGGVLTVNSDLTAASVSGFSAIVAKADAMTVTGGIELAEGATITIDMTGHVQEGSDAAILVTGEGITGITDDDIVLTGEGAGVYHAYYNHVDNSIHAMRIDNFYVDVAYGTAGELIPEGAVNPITGETLLFGVNAFYYLNNALDKMAPGQNLYINGRIGNNVATRGQVANIYLTGSTVPVLINGYTNGDRTYTGDISVTIEDSTIATAAGSYLFGYVSDGEPWNHQNRYFGSATFNLINSSIGGDANAILLTGCSFNQFYGTEENPALIQFNFKDSIIRDDLLFIGDSPVGKTVEIDGKTYIGANVEINFDNVYVPNDKWWRIQDGDQQSEGTVTVNIKGTTIGKGDQQGQYMMRFSLGDWSQATPRSNSDFIFNVENSQINGNLSAGRADADFSELPGYTGAKTLNLAGENSINYTYWFKTLNLASDATFTGRTLRMASTDAAINIDLTGYTGSSKVFIVMDNAFENVTVENINVIGLDEESPYTIVTDFDPEAEAPALTTVVLKGAIKDIYVNSEYTEEDFKLGTSYNGEALFFGENAFSTIEEGIAALTVEGAGLYVTGGKVKTSALPTNSLTIDASAQLTYSGNTVITIDGTLSNEGTLLIQAAGFIDETSTDILVLTASSITGEGTFRTDNSAYSLNIVGNELHLIMKKLDVFVNTAWEGLEAETVVEIPGGTAIIGSDAFATADAAAAAVSANGSITILASDVAFTNAIVRTVTATEGSIVRNANVGTGTAVGSLTLKSGAVAMAASVRGKGVLTVEAGATVTGGLGMLAGAQVSFAEGSTLDIDISKQNAGESASVTNYSILTGAPNITITIAAGQADGVYALATDAAAFASNAVLQTSAGKIGDLVFGQTVQIDGIDYTLAVDEESKVLSLTKQVYVAPITVTYVNSEWASLEDGTVVSGATIGYDGFATGDAAIAAVVAYGEVKVLGGEVSFTNAIDKTVTINAGATLVGAATFATAVTINGAVAFDTQFATAEAAQFGGFSFVSGAATYTLTGAGAVGTYLLATDAAAFASDITFGSYTLKVGEDVIVDDAFTYTLSVTDGTLALTVTEYVPPTPDTPTLAFVNSEWSAAEAGTVVAEGATIGYNAFAALAPAIAGVTPDGSVEVVGGEISFADGYSKTITVDGGVTVFGKATFTAPITINGTIAFNTADATDTAAQFKGFSNVSGDASYTLTAEAVAGTYLLASGVATFASDIAFGEYLLTVGGEAVTIGDFTYAVSLNEGNLALVIESVGPGPGPEPVTLAFVNSEWAGQPAGAVVAEGATIGYNAFAALSGAEAAVTDDGAVEVVGGEISFADGYSKTITVDAGATVIGKATFDKAITINGTIAFNTAEATAEAAQFGGFSFVSGAATYTLSVVAPTAGTYLLAADAATFNSPVVFGTTTLTVGAAAVLVGDYEYALGITDNNELALSVTEYIPPTPTYDLVYVNSEWAGLEDGTVVLDGAGTIGANAFASGDLGIANVTADGTVEVVGGEVSFTNTTAKAITIDAGATLVGKATFGAAITINGTVAFNTADATATAAQFGGFSFVTGSATYTLTAAAVAGTYLLASDAATFNSNVAFGDYTLAVGAEAVTIGDFKYALGITDNNELALVIESVGPVPPPTPTTPTKAFVNSEWAGLEDGTVIAGATIGYDGFAALAPAIAGITDDGSIEVVGGEISFADGYSKTITVDAGATVVGKATFDKAITINGTIAFNTADASATAAQFNGFSFVSGAATYTLTAAAVAGTYLLASDAATFNSNVAFGDYTLAVGAEAVTIGDFKYALGITDNNDLALVIEAVGPVPPPPVEGTFYVNNAWADLADGTVVTVGDKTATIGTDAFATGDAAAAKATEGITIEVLAGPVSFTDPITEDVTIEADASLTGKVEADAVITVDGTLVFDTAFATDENAQITGFDNFVFGDNASVSLTVSGQPKADDKFILATGVTALPDGFSVKLEGHEGLTLTVDDAKPVGVVIEGLAYGLELDGDALVLSVVNFDNGSDKTDDKAALFNGKTFNKNAFDALDGVTITKETTNIPIDKKFSVNTDDLYNYVGIGVGGTDVSDVRKVTLESGAKLTLNLEGQGTASGKLVVYQINEKNGKYTLKAVSTISFKNSFDLESKKAFFLEAGDYLFAMEGKIKKEVGSYYSVSLVGGKSFFYEDDDNGANNWIFDKKQTPQWNPAVVDADAIIIDETSVGELVQLDDADPSKAGFENFVGFGDAMDIRKVEFATAANVNFDITLNGGAGKFFLYTVDAKGKLKTVANVALKASGSLKKPVLVDAGTYYLAVQSTNAKKGEAVYYNVAVSNTSTFFVDGDTGLNNYDSKAKAVTADVNANPVDLTKGELVIDGLIPGEADVNVTVGGVEYHNFVGYGDASDIVKINAGVGQTVSLKVTSSDAVSLTLYGLKNGKVTSIKSVKSKNNVATIENFTFADKNGSEFYVGVEATNAKKGEAAYYNVEVLSFSGDNGVSLDLAAADTFGAKDDLSSGIIDTLALGDTSVADAWKLDDKSSWQSIANLA